MASMKELIEGECGDANPLMKLTSHFSHEGLGQQEFYKKSQSHSSKEKEMGLSTEQDLVNEFFTSTIPLGENNLHQAPLLGTAPATFGMEELLFEMQQIDRRQQLLHQLVPVTAPSVVDILSAEKWLDEIGDEFKAGNIKEELKSGPPVDGKWLDEIVNEFHQDASQHELIHQLPDWSTDFLADKSETSVNQADILESAWSPNQIIPFPEERHDWLSDFIKDNERDVLDRDSKVTEKSDTTSKEEEDEETKFWDMAQREWSNIERSGYPLTWENEFLQFGDHLWKEYKFEEENPVVDYPEALQEGMKRWKEGDVSNAVLFLEAAIQKDPGNSEAWFYLGQSQAENEQDPSAISAFNKCLELDSSNLKALMSLAVSYTNEGIPHKALESLFQWLKRNPKYSGLVEGKIFESYKVAQNAVSSEDDLIELFLQAARKSSEKIDPHLQDGLGVLFNISGDYAKAADCFRTALQLIPEDSTMWNRLGATLANGSKSEEAVEAYYHALNLRPGLVRTRFNLGIACINLCAYKESAEHLISALNLQHNSRGPISEARENSCAAKTSKLIWSTLHMLLCVMGRSDLLPACDKQQLDVFNIEFNIH